MLLDNSRMKGQVPVHSAYSQTKDIQIRGGEILRDILYLSLLGLTF